jgi:hypothetical protein
MHLTLRRYGESRIAQHTSGYIAMELSVKPLPAIRCRGSRNFLASIIMEWGLHLTMMKSQIPANY